MTQLLIILIDFPLLPSLKLLKTGKYDLIAEMCMCFLDFFLLTQKSLVSLFSS